MAGVGVAGKGGGVRQEGRGPGSPTQPGLGCQLEGDARATLSLQGPPGGRGETAAEGAPPWGLPRVRGPGLRSDKSPLSWASARPSWKRGDNCSPLQAHGPPRPAPPDPWRLCLIPEALAALKKSPSRRQSTLLSLPGLEAFGVGRQSGPVGRGRGAGRPPYPVVRLLRQRYIWQVHFQTSLLGNCLVFSVPPHGCMLDFVLVLTSGGAIQVTIFPPVCFGFPKLPASVPKINTGCW